MTPGDDCARLVRRIAGILSGGIRVKADVRHFIESTFGSLSLEALGAFLQDESDCERDTLLDLLFFPDEPFQMQIEDLLADLELTPADIEETTARLGRLKPAARFFFGGHLPPLIVEMPRFLCRRVCLAAENLEKNGSGPGGGHRTVHGRSARAAGPCPAGATAVLTRRRSGLISCAG